ncbi:MAG: hypothetical protein RJA07_2236 [Bacteroidota bacterium]|jgi:uncharacterized damage-inducible protein DinB
MTKAYFLELADYNIWANDKVINWLNKISEEQYNQQITSSFSTIKDTCIHIASAEKVWLERWQRVENPMFLAVDFKGSKSELIAIWQQASTDIKEFIASKNETEFENKLSFKRLNGDLFLMEFSKTFAHVFNHSTFHRGQLVTMFRQAGFINVESTDLLSYYRELEK